MNRLTTGALCAALLLPLFAPLASAQDQQTLAENYVIDVGKTVKEVAKEATPKTVCIEIHVGARKGYGSGAIISSDGLILTCAHVVEPGQRLTVVTHDGSRYDARTVGINSKNDYALIKIEASDLAVFELGSSAELEVKEWVIALGHPGGPYTDLKPTVAVGRVRGKGKKLPIGMGAKFYKDAILTDCPIFGGNSGGPLVDLDGKLVGINGAILLVNKNAYAASIDEIKADLQAMRAGRKIEGGGPMGMLDPRMWQYMQDMQKEITPEQMEKLYKRSPMMKMVQELLGDKPRKPKPKVKVSLGARLKSADGGLVFRNVEPMGTVGLAGIRRGDRLVSIDDWPVRNTTELRRALLTFEEGMGTTVVVRRKDELVTRSLLFAPRNADRQPMLRYAFHRLGRKIAPSTVLVKGQQDGYGTVLSEGWVLTADHILGADAREVRVRLANGIGLPARVWGRDGKLDVALLKVDLKGQAFTAAKLAAEGPEIGDWVLSGGDKRGPLVVGAVSAVDRSVLVERKSPTMGLFGMLGSGALSPLRPYDKVIHHDTPLSEGTFGSGLFNSKGELVGVNVALWHRGSSYAIPIGAIKARMLALQSAEIVAPPELWQEPAEPLTFESLLKQFFNQMQEPERPAPRRIAPRQPGPVVRGDGYIGVSVDRERGEGHGIMISDVVAGQPAAEAGLRAGDVVIRVGDKRVRSAPELIQRVSALEPGTKTTVTVVRGQGINARTMKLDITIGRRPQ